MEFDMPKEMSSIIKVIGVGGGGSNAVNHMYSLGIQGVDFIVCNTDKQALDISPVPVKIQLGEQLTEGRGAGAIPEVGREAAIEAIDEIKEILTNNTRMVFVTAGMGGGTGTGAAPVVAKVAKEMGILTVGIVTVPFGFEGRKRRMQAEEGLEQIRSHVDTLLVINNEKLREITGNLSISNAFSKADSVLSTAAKSIADVISVTGAINVDFNDVKTVMKDSGVAIMGSGIAEGDNRAIECVETALQSPLLNDNDITGANYVLLNITYGENEVTMDEISIITDYVQDQAGNTAEIIFGHGQDESLGEQLSVTLIATGFQKSPLAEFEKAPEKKTVVLEDTVKNEIVEPLTKPTESIKQEEDMYIKTVETPTDTASNIPSFDSLKAREEKKETNLFDNEFIFEVETPAEKQEEQVVTRHLLEEDMSIENTSSIQTISFDTPKHTISDEEAARISNERLEEIRRYTSSLRTSEGLAKYESEPAYVRKNIELDETVHSHESATSRFSITEDAEKTTLNSNNSFLHDNVD